MSVSVTTQNYIILINFNKFHEQQVLQQINTHMKVCASWETSQFGNGTCLCFSHVSGFLL